MDVSVSGAIEQLGVAKLSANRRPAYVKHLRFCLQSFAVHIGNPPLVSVTTEHVEAFLAKVGRNPWSRATYIARLSTLFEFSRRRRWIVENPCFFLEKTTIDQTPPTILSPDDAWRLVALCRERFPNGLAWLALTLFAGLRPQEAGGMRWEKIDLAGRRIWIDPGVSKIRRMRIVEPKATAVDVLSEAKALGSSLPIPLSTRRRITRKLRTLMGWSAWPKDITRHSCASYWLALEPDAGRIALQLGNSATVLMRHYRAVVTREDAEKFFTLPNQQ